MGTEETKEERLTHATKVHPNTAQGGNGALETSAVLANTLLRKLDETPTLSEADIEAVFAEVQAVRYARAAGSLEQGRRTSAVSTKDTLVSRLVVHYLLPYLGDRIIIWLAVKHAESSAVIERLPLPSRNGVTLPHAGSVAKRGGGKVPWRLGAIGTVGLIVGVALLYLNRSPGLARFNYGAVEWANISRA